MDVASTLSSTRSTRFPGAGWAAFVAVVHKEIAGHFRSRRFTLGAAATLALCMLAVHIRAHDYREADRERNLFMRRWMPAVLEQIDRSEVVQVESARAMSPLAVLSVGMEPVLPFRFTSTKEGLRFGHSRGSANPMDVLLGHLDIAFITSTLLSLLCIAFTFDAISGERTAGTLALVLSQPIDRLTFYTAKIAGNAAVISICFLPAFVLSGVLTWLLGIPTLSLVNWWIYGSLALIYLLFFTTLGVAISSSRGEPIDSALRGIFVWVLIVFVIPRVASVAVNYVAPPSRLTELALQEEAALSKLKVEYTRRVGKAVQRYLEGSGGTDGNDRFKEERSAAVQDLRAARHTVLAHMWDAQRREEDRRDRWVRALSGLSAAAVFQQAAAELAWTGREQRRHFLLEARTYDEKVGRPLAESREYHASSSREGGRHSIVLYDDVRTYLVPFRPTWAAPSVIQAAVAMPAMLLVIMVLVTAWIGQYWFRKLDVRS